MSDSALHATEAHPDYEYETTAGPRKAFDERTPDGEGWERNVHRGRDGWERFDAHEEAYWMRRKAPSDAADHLADSVDAVCESLRSEGHIADLELDLTATIEQRDVYRDRAQQLAGRVTALSDALRALIARVRRTGGYASPEEQRVLWEAERVVGGGCPHGLHACAEPVTRQAEDEVLAPRAGNG